MDAFLCSGTLKDKAALVKRYLTYCHGVSSGDMLVVSFGQPETRLHLLKCGVWADASVEEITCVNDKRLNSKCWVYTLVR